jgi:hypothetical protein
MPIDRESEPEWRIIVPRNRTQMTERDRIASRRIPRARDLVVALVGPCTPALRYSVQPLLLHFSARQRHNDLINRSPVRSRRDLEAAGE